MGKIITGSVISQQGFYIGDLCYTLSNDLYDEVWGGAGYADGIYADPDSGIRFAVAGTAYGDGTYMDQNGRDYPVDAGNISLVAGELAEDKEAGQYFPGAGEAFFTAEGGLFQIQLPSGETVIIDTGAVLDGDDADYQYQI